MPRRMNVARATTVFVLTFWLAAGWGGCQRPPMQTRPAPPAGLARPIRAVWVARFHYRYQDDVRTIVRNCKQLGFNTLLWQVRGDGTVAYPSRIEPWSREFDHRDPGFDPLAIAIDEARKNGMRIEAWVNVMPGWRGPKPPPIRGQLYFTHPGWFLHDEAGRRQPLDEFYAVLNPCLPEVRHYIVSIIQEIAANYDIDGIHLDYVRYAWETTADGKRRFPRDRETLALYQRETGKRPDDDAAAWDAWRAEQLTRLVVAIRETLSRERPGATLTAAGTPDPKAAYDRYLQNGADWLRRGLLDAVMPMAYTADIADFERYVGAYQRIAPRGRVVPGLGVYKVDRSTLLTQLARCEAWGGDFAAFSYTSFYPTADNRGKPTAPAVQAARADMRRVVRVAVGEAVE